jgi:hypothetical protein
MTSAGVVRNTGTEPEVGWHIAGRRVSASICMGLGSL